MSALCRRFMKRKAVLIGASGRVGQALTRELAALYDTLIVITRTQPATISENTHIYHVQNFDALSDTIASMAIGADTDAFSCLGMDKQDAMSEDEFYQVNVLFNIAFAKACQDKGVQRFFYLSKMGADKAGRDTELIARADVEHYLKSLDFSKVVFFRLHKLTFAKDKFSFKTAGRFGLNLAKNTLSSALSLDKKQRLTPKRVAAAMSLTAYRLHLHNKHQSFEPHLVISHDEMCAMTEVDKHP